VSTPRTALAWLVLGCLPAAGCVSQPRPAADEAAQQARSEAAPQPGPAAQPPAAPQPEATPAPQPPAAPEPEATPATSPGRVAPARPAVPVKQRRLAFLQFRSAVTEEDRTWLAEQGLEPVEELPATNALTVRLSPDYAGDPVRDNPRVLRFSVRMQR